MKRHSYNGIYALCAITLIAPVLAGCAEIRPNKMSTPPLVSGLAGNQSQKSDEFDKRIKLRFPIGSSAIALKTELTRDEFSIVPPSARSGEFHFENVALKVGAHTASGCSEAWKISWNQRLGKITDIKGGFGLICLGC